MPHSLAKFVPPDRTPIEVSCQFIAGILCDRLERGSPKAAWADEWVLPDLVMLPPADFHLEKKAKGGRWLRFSTTIVNIGPGLFDVYGYEPNEQTITSSSRLAVAQRLQDTTGAFTA